MDFSSNIIRKPGRFRREAQVSGLNTRRKRFVLATEEMVGFEEL